MTGPVGVVVVGAGPIGLGVAREVSTRRGLALVGVVDTDPHKQGQEVVAGVTIAERAPEDARVAVLCTTSSLAKLEVQAQALLERGLCVVSTCEELAWPHGQPDIAARLDAAAKRHGVALLGTGVNPGFLMDALPWVLTAPCRAVEHVRVERIQDAAARRLPFQAKVGVGMRPGDVEEQLRAGRMGHVGLGESAHFLGAQLGFPLDTFEEQRRVIVAEQHIERAGRVVEPGQVLGVEQSATGACGGVERVALFFRAVFGEDNSRDHIVVTGTPPLDVTIAGGVPGDVATCAIVVNAIPAVLRARPGLVTMADVTVGFSA